MSTYGLPVMCVSSAFWDLEDAPIEVLVFLALPFQLKIVGRHDLKHVDPDSEEELHAPCEQPTTEDGPKHFCNQVQAHKPVLNALQGTVAFLVELHDLKAEQVATEELRKLLQGEDRHAHQPWQCQHIVENGAP